MVLNNLLASSSNRVINIILFVILIFIVCGGLWYMSIASKGSNNFIPPDKFITPTNTPQIFITPTQYNTLITPITTPINISNPCLPINPCKNGGECIPEAETGFFRCVCPTYPNGEPMFIGRDCGFTAD